MGILDSIFGGGQQGPPQQGPRPDSWHDRFQAEYAPGAYGAHQQSQQQQAVFNAAMQTQGMSPQVAQALAMSPQFFGAQQGTYLPQPSQTQVLTDSQGNQTIGEIRNPGGSAGHSRDFSGLPITPPGTTASPAAASGAQGGTTPPEQTGNAPAASSGPQNTLQGMPGSTTEIFKLIETNKAAGRDPTTGIPEFYKGMANAVREGRETLKDITSQRGAPTRNIVNAIVQAAEPEFDENMNEARNTYRKQFVSGKATDIGGQIKSINKLAGHANEIADASTNMDNIGLGGSELARPINKLGNYLYSTPGAGLKRAADLYNNELSTYVSGKGGSGVDERKSRQEAFDPNATPQSMGKTLLTDIAFIEKQIEGNEQQRDSVWKGTKLGSQFELASPEAHEQLNQAKIKAHKLVGDYEEWAKSPEGQKAHGPGGGGGLPPGVTVKKLP